MAVAVREQFVGAFSRGVQRNRLIDLIAFAKRHPGVGTIDRAAGGVDQVGRRMMPAGFEDVEKADQIRLRVGVGIVEGVADSGLRGEVNDLFESALHEQRGQCCRVDDVQPLESEIGQRLQSVQPRLFEFDVVVRIQIIDANDRKSLAT